MVIGQSVGILFLYLLYSFTHGKIIVSMINGFFDIFISVHTICAVQIGIVLFTLSVIYYFRTNLSLFHEIYKNYSPGIFWNDTNYPLSEMNFFLFMGFFMFLYPVILIITFIDKISLFSSIISIIPYLILSSIVSKGETVFCDYNLYLKKLDKNISLNETFVCNIIVI